MVHAFFQCFLMPELLADDDSSSSTGTSRGCIYHSADSKELDIAHCNIVNYSPPSLFSLAVPSALIRSSQKNLL